MAGASEECNGDICMAGRFKYYAHQITKLNDLPNPGLYTKRIIAEVCFLGDDVSNYEKIDGTTGHFFSWSIFNKDATIRCVAFDKDAIRAYNRLRLGEEYVFNKFKVVSYNDELELHYRTYSSIVHTHSLVERRQSALKVSCDCKPNETNPVLMTPDLLCNETMPLSCELTNVLDEIKDRLYILFY